MCPWDALGTSEWKGHGEVEYLSLESWMKLDITPGWTNTGSEVVKGKACPRAWRGTGEPGHGIQGMQAGRPGKDALPRSVRVGGVRETRIHPVWTP